MKEIKDVVKGLYIYFFSNNPDIEEINMLMVNLEEITNNWLTSEEREECIKEAEK